MINIDKNSPKYLALLIVIYIVMGLILYPILDILYCKFITRSVFTYSVVEDVIKPVVIGLVMALVTWFFERKKVN